MKYHLLLIVFGAIFIYSILVLEYHIFFNVNSFISFYQEVSLGFWSKVSRVLFILSLNHFAVPPQIHPFDFGEEASNSGDIVMATCLITKGDLPVTMRWTLNNKPVNELDGISTTNANKRANQITIESVQDHHRGEYKCLAENKAGVAEFSAILNVNGIGLIFVCFQKQSLNLPFP